MLEKVVVRVLLVPMLCVMVIAWSLMGLVSIRALGRVLSKTGHNLEEYTW